VTGYEILTGRSWRKQVGGRGRVGGKKRTRDQESEKEVRGSVGNGEWAMPGGELLPGFAGWGTHGRMGSGASAAG